ncbi:MAG: hypothetical protein GTO45_23530 [Candidatus Aminicenantes bacterium]|nr:hypothetical protein [Candidatus Aminicenantes bacterium]NIM81730.1 hypothetical protein [Candidatus Aminicenantes bacterium]NIN21101.1 hypothetical protein [Candidatus Aminicenantes bacterium]NIN44923.1 hypothetical protein [Candidatus Aminicenantes bacterium]NIN87737.1 hypothetical protein [Candidatus Aminicenantes bacterium]
MTQSERKQNRRMKWVLFYVFVAIFVAIVTLTIMVVFFGFGDTTEQERDFLFKVFIGEVGIAMITLFKVLFGLKKKPVGEETAIPSVNGRYKYELNLTGNKTTYLGECRVKQDGRVLTFNGERQKECNGLKKKKVSVHWYSNWAELCADNKVRLDYAITLNGGVRGYAILDVGSKNSTKGMVGEFHLLHEPYVYGTVKFKRA